MSIRTNLVALVALALGACTYTMPENIDPLDGTTLSVTAGDAQTALVGSTLTAPIIIQATDIDGNPVPNLTLALELTGGGRVPEPAIRTDLQGFATTVLTLGTVPGENRVTAQVLGLEIDPAIATAIALVGPPTTLSVESGDGQQGTAGYELAAPLVVRAADQYDNPVPEALVELAVLGGGGTLSETSITTSASGTASATLVLGQTMGANTIEARVGLLSPVELTALGVAGAPAVLVKALGDGQSAPAGTMLPTQLTVRVDDEFGNPVANQQIQFVASAGGGTVNPEFATTGANGEAMTTYRLGPSAIANTIEARLAPLVTASFTAAGLTGAVASIAIVSGNTQSGVVNTTLPSPLVVEAKDAQGNLIQGAIINFEVPAGGSAPNATTGANGRASSSYKLSTTAGSNAVRARVGSVYSATFALTGTPGPASRVSFLVSPPVGIQQIDAVFPVTARVTDQFNNAVTNQPTISWTASPQQLSASNGASTTITITQMLDFTVEARSGALVAATAPVNVRGFKPRVDIASTASHAKFFVADMNNDNKPDVVSFDTSGLYVQINTTVAIGTPRFTPPIPFVSNMSVREVSIGNLNADNLPDLLLVHDYVNTPGCYGGCVAVLRNSTGTGAQTPILTHSIVDSSPAQNARLVDVNLDARGDIVIARNSYFDVLFGTSSGAFDPPQVVLHNGYGQLVSTPDLNVDGRADLLCQNGYVFINTTAVGGTTPAFTQTSTQPFVGFIDFDGDDKLDGVASYYSQFDVYRNTTSPGATNPMFTHAGSHTSSGSELSPADFNSDGRQDYAFSNNGTVTVLLNRTTGTTSMVSSGTSLSPAAGYPYPRGMGVGDFDADGKQDILTISGDYSSSSLLQFFLSE